MFRSYVNKFRTRVVFYILQNFLFKCHLSLRLFGIAYLVIHSKQTLQMLKILKLARSLPGFYIFGPIGGSGGTYSVSEKLYSKALLNTHENVFLFRGSLPSKGRNNISSQSTFYHIVDSKILLGILLFKKVQASDIWIYEWNGYDFTHHAAKILDGKNQITVLNHQKRNNSQNNYELKWSESTDLFITPELTSEITKESDQRVITVNFIGRLTYQKGIDVFLDLVCRNPQINFRIFGSGPFDSVVQKSAITNTNLEFAGYASNVFSHLSRGDIIIVPSRYFEGTSLVVLEGLTRGMTVVSTGIDGLSVIRHSNHFYPDEGQNFIEYAENVIRTFS